MLGRNTANGGALNGGNQRLDSRASQPQSVTSPKVGAAIRRIEEKFAAKAVVGIGSITMSIAVSSSHLGFDPHPSLSYHSGASDCDSPFGFGWSLARWSITRKCARALPRYLVAEDSGGLTLSKEEKLVPGLDADSQGIDDRTSRSRSNFSPVRASSPRDLLRSFTQIGLGSEKT